MEEYKRNREFARLRFGNLSNSSREALPFGKLAIVFCVLLDERIVTTANCCKQSDRQRASASESGDETLLPPLRHLLHPQPLSLGQCFAGKTAFFDDGSEEIMGELVAGIFAAAEGA